MLRRNIIRRLVSLSAVGCVFTKGKRKNENLFFGQNNSGGNFLHFVPFALRCVALKLVLTQVYAKKNAKKLINYKYYLRYAVAIRATSSGRYAETSSPFLSISRILVELIAQKSPSACKYTFFISG